MVDIAVGGYFDKMTEEVYDIYEIIATNSQQNAAWGRRAGIHEVNTSYSNLVSQIDDISRNMDMLINWGTMVKKQCSFCEMIGHNDVNCGYGQGMNIRIEEVNYIGGFEKPQLKNDPYSNTYNLG